MIKERIKALQNLLKKNGIHAYIIPSTDPHQDEYLPENWERRRWISGFTGSAGDVLVTRDNAGLWTDSRYFLQAEKQLKGSGISLFKSGLPETPTQQEWLKDNLKPGQLVGIDPKVISRRDAENLKDFLNSWNMELKAVEENLVDTLWDEQPMMPETAIDPHPVKYSGESTDSKLTRLQEKLKDQNADAHIITTLDSIAWLFNIRGHDIAYNPLTIAYAIITRKKAMLFTSSSKVSREVKKQLGKNVTLHEYEEFEKQVKKLDKSGNKIWVDPSSVSWWITRLPGKKCDLFFRESPVIRMKAIRNGTQINGLRAAHVRDGAAMVKFLYWLSRNLEKIKITEMSAAEKLEKFRAVQDLYQGPSFETISAYREHGAIVHYASSPETDVELKPEGIYLIDSGGHYLDGTTDITRTITLGEPSSEQQEHFTRVLKGHIQLALTRFPKGTAGNQLDTIARKPLWDIGLNYGHGTGHGIGSYLNVHEGPQAISYYRGIGVPLEPGMVVSNEPGYYLEGEYGIRIENLILTQTDDDKANFLRFETVTLCPIDLRLVEKSLLSREEIEWLNNYHATVRKSLKSLLTDEERKWLEAATQEI